jgi:cytidylate kinase
MASQSAMIMEVIQK